MQLPKNRAFTLIELLVVISIIALLMGILLPYLGTARERARRTACMANLHSISQAVFIYAQNNDNRLIPGDSGVPWDVWGMKTEGEEFDNTHQKINLGHLISSDVLPKPENRKHIFFCPSHRTVDGSQPYEDFTQKWGSRNTQASISYMFNNALDGFGNYIQLCDEAVLAHKDKINYLLGDGSVHLFTDLRLSLNGGRPLLLNEISATAGVIFPSYLIHKWLEKGKIDIDEAKEYLHNPADWMEYNSTLSVSKQLLVSDISKKSLVSDVIGAPLERPASTGSG